MPTYPRFTNGAVPFSSSSVVIISVALGWLLGRNVKAEGGGCEDPFNIPMDYQVPGSTLDSEFLGDIHPVVIKQTKPTREEDETWILLQVEALVSRNRIAHLLAT